MRIGSQGTGQLTVEKRHQEELKRLNPTVQLYDGFLLREKRELELFSSRFYNPDYAIYAFNPHLCSMEGCGRPVSVETRLIKDSDGRRPHLCKDHLDMVFGKKRG